MEETEKNSLKKFNTLQFLHFALGFFGLQFAWQLEIILSGPVTERLGASPFIFGLIWLAGPITGVLVQPIIGAISDKTSSKFGRRRPYLLTGALLGSIALWIFPNSGSIVHFIGNHLNINFPIWTALLLAAMVIWVIDASVNMSQGPYRALISDVIPFEQHSIANSYISLAIGLGSVVASGTAPFLKWAFNYQMSIPLNFLMGSLTFSLSMIWTCLKIKEIPTTNLLPVDEGSKSKGFLNNFKTFFGLSPQVPKICAMQFCTWVGTMCMLIFFTQYSVHTVFEVPDLMSVGYSVKSSLEGVAIQATNYASICFTVFNLICFLFAVPIGFLSSKFGKKKVHLIALSLMCMAFLGMAFVHDKSFVIVMMAIAGIGWASLLALPFAMLSKYIKRGNEGVSMGIFNIFIAASQIITCTAIAWIISKCAFKPVVGVNYHWEYVFFIGALCLLGAISVLSTINEHD